MKPPLIALVTRRPSEAAFSHPKEKTMWTALAGYKTYILVVLFLVMVAVEKVMGWDVPGFEVGDDWMTWVWGALGLGTLRMGIAGK